MTLDDPMPKTKTKVMHEAPERPVTLDPAEARQGESGRSMVTVLLGSLALAAFVWIGAEIYGALVQDENFVTDDAVPATTTTEPSAAALDN